MSIQGLERKAEITETQCEEVTISEDGNSIQVIFNLVKSTGNKHKNEFTIIDPVMVEIVKKYYAAIPVNDRRGRYFRKMSDGCCTRQHLGINTIADIGKDIAKFLGKEDWALYTSHCFRGTAATILAEKGMCVYHIIDNCNHYYTGNDTLYVFHTAQLIL